MHRQVATTGSTTGPSAAESVRSGFVGNDTSSLTSGAPLGAIGRRVQCSSRHSTSRPRHPIVDRQSGRRRSASRAGSAGGTGTRAADRTRSGGAPGISCSSVVVSEMVEPQQLPGVRVLRSAKTSATVPCSTIRPAYMTATRSHASADDAQVVRDQQHGRLRSGAGRPRMLHDLGLDQHVQRGGRLVGDDEPAAAPGPARS